MSVKVEPYTTEKKEKAGFKVEIRWRSIDGKFHRDRRWVSLPNKTAAQRWGEQREQELIKQAMLPAPPEVKEVPTLNEFAPRFMREHAVANQLKPSGIHHKEVIFRVHLLPQLGQRRLDRIDNPDVQQLKYALREKSAHTVNNVLTLLNVVLKKALEWGVIDTMPCTIKLLRTPPGSLKVFDLEQYERLIEAATNRLPEALLIVLLGGDAGLRSGEMRALQWDDVDFQTGRAGQITVRRSEWHGQTTSTKGNRTRFVPMTTRLGAALKRHQHLRGPLVLHRKDGKPMAEHHLEEVLRGALRDAGLKGGPHVLRHTFCSLAIANGLSVKEVQQLAGHQDLKTLERYVHLTPGALHAAMEQFDRRRAERLGNIRATRNRVAVSA
jgi:integrase